MSGIVVYPTWALPHQPVPTSSAMRNADAYFGERHIYKGRVARKREYVPTERGLSDPR